MSDIVIPEDIIVNTSKKHTSSISKAFGTNSETLFFTIVVAKDGKYHLVDRYDVYVAAKTVNCKKVRAFVLSNSDDVTAHLTLSMKHFPNPVTVLKMIRPFVDKYGLKKTLDMFYLDSVFGNMYNTNLSSEILDELESLIQFACLFGVRSVVPIQIFQEIKRRDSVENQILLIQHMFKFIEVFKSKFRWPHNEFLRALSTVESEQEQPAIQRKKENTANTDVREFECINCNAEYIVTPTHIGPRNETDGLIIISGDDDHSEPVYSLPSKYQKYLGVSKESPPVIVSSKDMDWKSLQEKMSRTKFVVYFGIDAR